MKRTIKTGAVSARKYWAISLYYLKNLSVGLKKGSIAGFLLCFAAVQVVAAETKPEPGSSAIAAQQSASTVPNTVTRLTCNAFYLPARNLWQRTVAVEYDGEVVRSVQIDDVPVYTFTVSGSSLLTGVDGERIQFDVAAMTWTSDLRGLVTSTGQCTP